MQNSGHRKLQMSSDILMPRLPPSQCGHFTVARQQAAAAGRQAGRVISNHKHAASLTLNYSAAVYLRSGNRMKLPAPFQTLFYDTALLQQGTASGSKWDPGGRRSHCTALACYFTKPSCILFHTLCIQRGTAAGSSWDPGGRRPRPGRMSLKVRGMGVGSKLRPVRMTPGMT